LLRAKADPNIPDEDQRTPLHRCAFHGWDICTSLLLECGAERNAKDDRMHTPMDLVSDRKTKKIIENFSSEETKRLLQEWDNKKKKEEKI
jgi:ankyrin repeat protein